MVSASNLVPSWRGLLVQHAKEWFTAKHLFMLIVVSLTLVTSFFETSKLWACIIIALAGLECLGQYRAFAGYRDQ